MLSSIVEQFPEILITPFVRVLLVKACAWAFVSTLGCCEDVPHLDDG